MLPFAFEVNNFFHFRKTFRFADQSRFPQSREAVMLPFALKVNNFFRFRKTFRFARTKSFSSIARSGYAPLRFTCQPLFFVPANFFAVPSKKRFPCRERLK